jgi:hypothetical protein
MTTGTKRWLIEGPFWTLGFVVVGLAFNEFVAAEVLRGAALAKDLALWLGAGAAVWLALGPIVIRRANRAEERVSSGRKA